MGLIENMLTCNFGEKEEKIKVTFRKTVKVREYETESTEISNEIYVNENLNGMERIFIAEVLKCQAEYITYIDLYKRGIVTDDEYRIKRNEIEETLNTIIIRANSVGVDTSRYLQAQ